MVIENHTHRWNLAALYSSLPMHVFPGHISTAVTGFDAESRFAATIQHLFEHHGQQSATASSDYVRYVLLYHFGGLYVDTDTIMLRDMRPFMGQMEWFYRWEEAVSAGLGSRMRLR